MSSWNIGAEPEIWQGLTPPPGDGYFDRWESVRNRKATEAQDPPIMTKSNVFPETLAIVESLESMDTRWQLKRDCQGARESNGYWVFI